MLYERCLLRHMMNGSFMDVTIRDTTWEEVTRKGEIRGTETNIWEESNLSFLCVKSHDVCLTLLQIFIKKIIMIE